VHEGWDWIFFNHGRQQILHLQLFKR